MTRDDLKAGVLSGLVVGGILMVMEMVMIPFFIGGSPWAPLRLIAGISLGQEVVTYPATFDFKILLVATFTQSVLSMTYAMIFSFFIRKASLLKSIVHGLWYGMAIYYFTFFILPQAGLFEWFAYATHWVVLVCYVIFGGLMGYSIKEFQYHTELECENC